MVLGSGGSIELKGQLIIRMLLHFLRITAIVSYGTQNIWSLIREPGGNYLCTGDHHSSAAVLMTIAHQDIHCAVASESVILCDDKHLAPGSDATELT